MNSSRKLHPLQYLLVALGVLAIVSLKINVPFFEQGLTGTLLISLVACAALLGDYITGIFATILSLIALNYLHKPTGFNISRDAVYQSLEFLVAGSLICFLSWRERSLRSDNSTLISNAKELKGIIQSLQKDNKGKSNDAKKLRELNEELDVLVKQFLEDEDYWDKRWADKPTK